MWYVGVWVVWVMWVVRVVRMVRVVWVVAVYGATSAHAATLIREASAARIGTAAAVIVDWTSTRAATARHIGRMAMR